MRKALKVIEWTLLVAMGGFALQFLLAPLDWFERDPVKEEAKEKGYYYKVDSETQTYFDKKIRVDGVIYGNGELIVYMKGKGISIYEKIPFRVQVTTDTNETFTSSGGGSSSGVFTTNGYYRFRDVPQGIKEITIHQEAFNESFSFQVSLDKGGK